jgi:small subunit ribosomal protein S9
MRRAVASTVTSTTIRRFRRPELLSPARCARSNSSSGRNDANNRYGTNIRRPNKPTNETNISDIFKTSRMNSRHNPFSFRKNVVTLFPGDYADDEDDDEFRLANPFGPDADFDQDPLPKAAAASSSTAEKIFEELQKREVLEKKQREVWIQNSVPPVRTSIIDRAGRSHGVGGRKAAQASVWIQPGFGEVVVNGLPCEEYFIRQSDRELLLAPLVVTATCGLFDVQAAVRGGGLTGQAGALRLGLARALNHYAPHLYRPTLKFHGLLTRDARKVERKKIGHVKARKSPQWVRR